MLHGVASEPRPYSSWSPVLTCSDGALEQAPPPSGTLLVAYSLVGTLTTHHLNNSGVDKKESRQVIFKKVPERLR